MYELADAIMLSHLRSASLQGDGRVLTEAFTNLYLEHLYTWQRGQ